MTGNIPELECDLIMKGGITSGVVYPKAVVELSKKYRFRNIGGASAGAIAAGAAAAAEYGRINGTGTGIDGIAALPDDFAAGGVMRFFQPTREFRRAFAVLSEMLEQRADPEKNGSLAGILAKHYYPWWAKLGLVLLVIFSGWSFWRAGSLADPQVSIGLTGILALIIFFAFGAYRAVAAMQQDIGVKLPQNRFGICSGRTDQCLNQGPGLTDWLTNLFDNLAGLDPKGREGAPLTLRDLEDHDITLSVMTTCLTLGRPYRLPLDTAIFQFQEDEFRELFPDRVVDHMIRIAESTGQEATLQDGKKYWPFPGNYADPDDPQNALELPVIVAIRMSLSFPALLQAVPLYAQDHSDRDDPEPTLHRCWFSDGGISSNFPMHFFDSYLPTRPTFGISLGVHDERGNEEGSENAPADRVKRPIKVNSGRLPVFTEIDNMGGFLSSILSSAKDWQDTMLSQLSGYRERVVTVNLTSDEGGINLNMGPTQINRLSHLGELAGKNLVGDTELDYPGFDMMEHGWRRFLVTQQQARNLAHKIAISWDGTGPAIRAYADEPGRSYFKSSRPKDIEHVAGMIDGLVKLEKQWGKKPPERELKVPKPDAVMRITPIE